MGLEVSEFASLGVCKENKKNKHQMSAEIGGSTFKNNQLAPITSRGELF